MIRRGIVIEPFCGAELIVATGERDRKRVCAELALDAENGPRARGWMQAVYYQTGGAAIVIGLPTKRCAATLYHEALHVAHEVLSIHGVPVDYAGQELMCYLQEYIVRQVDRAVYTKRRGQRKQPVTK